jgi:hypothetical protein
LPVIRSKIARHGVEQPTSLIGYADLSTAHAEYTHQSEKRREEKNRRNVFYF